MGELYDCEHTICTIVSTEISTIVIVSTAISTIVIVSTAICTIVSTANPPKLRAPSIRGFAIQCSFVVIVLEFVVSYVGYGWANCVNNCLF